jgi:GAF domain-containing protein
MADVSKYLERAERFLQKRKFDSALEELMLALREDPRNDEARVKAADLCATLGHNAEAARLYGEAFQMHADLGASARALTDYKKLTHVAVPNVEQMLRYAELVERSNRTEAIQTLQAAITELVNGGATKQALEAQRKLVTLDPAIENIAYEAELAGAIRDYATAAERLVHAAEQATAEKKDDLAFHYLERAHEFDGRNRTAALAYSKALLERDQGAAALAVIEPFATVAEFRPLHARALMEAGKLKEAEPQLWAAYDKDASALPQIVDLVRRILEAGDEAGALRLMHRVEVRETQRKRRLDFIVMMKEVILRQPPNMELLKYLSELLNSANREHDYCDVLGRLFDVYYASGEFVRAGDTLDRAGEVDPYDPANQRRLDMLRGKLDPRRFRTVANRFGRAEQEAEATTPAEEGSEPTLLEDLMLQAEIFLRYNMRTRALERLERINRLFPDAEHNNPELMALYERGSYAPQHSKQPAETTVAPAAPPVAAGRAGDASPRAAVRSSSDPLGRVAEVARNMHRQTQMKGLFFGAVNDMGRCLEAKRVVAALCAPGKPPAGFAEYCAPKVTRATTEVLVKAIAAAGTATASQRFVSSETQPALKDTAAALQAKTLWGASLVYRDEVIGVLLIADAAAPAQSKNEPEVLQALADQLAIAAANVRLRQLVDALAARDERTGLLKRSAWFDALMFQVVRAMDQHEPLTLALMQIGTNASMRAMEEAAVEAMMLEAAQLVGSNIRQSDLAVRYDRGVMGLALAATDESTATKAVLKLRRVLSGSRLIGTSLGITCGIAQALLEPQYDPADVVTEVVNRVNSALEAAWAEGGNTGQSLPPPVLAEAAR